MPAYQKKRRDVGYKRPPVEHQFKPGQKPPPRKPKSAKPKSRAQLLAMILREELRVEIGGKARWCTRAELLVLIAFQLAERGNASVSRALADFLLAQEDPVEWEETWMQIGDPDCESQVFRVDGRTGMRLDDLKE
ncbi:DUF5681 domain-containing protein [Sphingomonas humi]|uniref:DUF5681 domain-containing protein n=1 Tax=Sphingomonas humi TaxID=335630 RepID=A0ABP7RXB5_9SPHN